MPSLVYDLFDFLGYLLRVIGFLVVGLAFGRIVLESMQGEAWQVRVALLLGLFGLLIALTVFATAGAAGAFALGAGAAYFWTNPPRHHSENEKTD
jgi:membrane protein DedA with SNARE-associated domain